MVYSWKVPERTTCTVSICAGVMSVLWVRYWVMMVALSTLWVTSVKLLERMIWLPSGFWVYS